MNKDTMKKYAEFGVRERLREIQREIDLLARDFPQIVRNADGTVPVVLPLMPKTKAAPTNGHGGRRESFAPKIDMIRAYLVEHPGALTTAIADAVNVGNTSTAFRSVLKTIARSTKNGTNKKAGLVWTLKK